MPELPEVETIVRALAPCLAGCRIVEAQIFNPLVARGEPGRIVEKVAGRNIRAVRRLGKNIVVELEDGVLTIHLGMTGKLLLDGVRTPYTRAVFVLDRGVLMYEDVRMFGRIEWNRALSERLASLGPDPLSLPFEQFREMLRNRRTRVKPLLLNQGFVRGMGNIYTDEALFRARIHPQAIACRLSAERAFRLHRAMVDVLTLAIEHRGSSVSDYVDSDGRKGGFQLLHQVYGKEGEPCPACGKPIRRIVVAQRGTHYCPRCQK